VVVISLLKDSSDLKLVFLTGIRSKVSIHSLTPPFPHFSSKKQSVNQIEHGSWILCSAGGYLLLETLLEIYMALFEIVEFECSFRINKN
jgi:hypothetical protein